MAFATSKIIACVCAFCAAEMAGELFRNLSEKLPVDGACPRLWCRAYNEGAELSVVQRQLRHTNPNTTARYLRSLGYEEEHSQKVLAVLEGRGRGKVIPFPQKQNPQSCNSRGSVHSVGTQLPTELKATGA